MQKRLKILLSNDDGIFAPGLYALWQALKRADIADIIIAAPSKEKSGAGVSITWEQSILVKKVEWELGVEAWSIDGTPADCIKMALNTILKTPPDFIVSGINAGSNAGRNVLHSGTVGAVIEGIFRGIPGVAFSCENGQNPNYHVAQKYVHLALEYVAHHPLPSGSFLNVNFPHSEQEKVKGFRLTRQGKGRWIETPVLRHANDQGLTYFLGGKPEEIEEDEDCDIALLGKGYMTAVPIYVHELTHMQELQERKEAFERFFVEKNTI